jgi:hypothetical protein
MSYKFDIKNIRTSILPALYRGIISIKVYSLELGSLSLRKPSVPSMGPGAIPLTRIC